MNAYHYTTKAVSIYYKKIKSNYIDEKTQCQLKVWLTLLIQHEIKSSTEFITRFNFCLIFTLNVPKLSSRSAYNDQTFRDLCTLSCTDSFYKIKCQQHSYYYQYYVIVVMTTTHHYMTNDVPILISFCQFLLKYKFTHW